MMRQRYEMTEQDLAALLEASKPVPYIIIGGVEPRTLQDNANAAWAALGDKMGFDYLTVEPTGEGDRFFTAEPKVLQ
jgi:hypothetical protein